MIDKLIRNIPPDVAAAVAEFRHVARLPTERAAYLQLIERGLASALAEPPEPVPLPAQVRQFLQAKRESRAS